MRVCKEKKTRGEDQSHRSQELKYKKTNEREKQRVGCQNNWGIERKEKSIGTTRESPWREDADERTLESRTS
jgi:hypothetical protein